MEEKHKDQLNREKLAALLGDGFDVTVADCLGSTNTELWKKAINGAKSGTIIIAKRQTGGKGRMGRSFLSESGGLYMSLLLRPELTPEDTALITPLASLAVAEAIERHTNNSALIKWVNDVYCNGKKVCGILTEASIDPLNLKTDFAVVGVGLNVYAPRSGFPEELKDIAGALFLSDDTEDGLLNSLAADIAKRIVDYSKRPFDNVAFETYKKRCFVLGKDINVYRGNESFAAKAVDLDRRFGMIVESDDGTRRTLNSGEVSVRLKGGGK